MRWPPLCPYFRGGFEIAPPGLPRQLRPEVRCSLWLWLPSRGTDPHIVPCGGHPNLGRAPLSARSLFDSCARGAVLVLVVAHFSWYRFHIVPGGGIPGDGSESHGATFSTIVRSHAGLFWLPSILPILICQSHQITSV